MFDKINAKLDELKQSVKNLPDAAQSNDDAPKVDAADTKSAQGKSNTPQDAKAIRNEKLGIGNNSEVIAEENTPADIFLAEDKFSAIKIPTAIKIDAPKIPDKVSVAEKIPDKVDDNLEIADEQSATNLLAASSMAYLFAMNSESLLEPVTKLESVESINLQSLLPTVDNNSQSMLQMLNSGTVIRNIPTQPIEIQTSQPTTIPTQPVEVQPSQPTTIPTQPVEVQPSQPKTLPTQPLEVQPSQPTTIPTQSVEVQPSQPTTIPTQPVEVQPSQPTTIPTQPVEVQPSQPMTIPTQPVEIVQMQTAQPILQQKVDEHPILQNLSEPLGVNVQVEETPTAAPVTPPESTPQQFSQNPQQQDAQNFQSQIFQPIIPDEVQAQPVSTGGEIFATNLATASDTPQTQQITSTQTPEAPPPPPQNDFDVPAQIVRQARLIRVAENTEMVIKLNPEHLGQLTLRVSVSSSGAVNASFHSDNAQVRTIIENSLVQLRHDLNNAGLKVENVQVYAGLSDGGLMNGQGGQAWQQNRRQSSGNRRINLNSIERDVDSTAPVNDALSADGVDYSV